jgi:hypothetical protein
LTLNLKRRGNIQRNVMAEVIHVHTPERGRYPQRQRQQKQFPDKVQCVVVCESVKSEPVTLKEVLESNKCKN